MDGVGLYRDDGVVLRTQKLGEADHIVTVLTRRTGRIRAVGKGVRRTKSRFGARLEPFTHVDLQLATGRSLDYVTQAETVRAYGEPLSADYPRYTSGTAMLETAERFTPVEKEPALRQFLLLVGGLRALGEAAHDPRLVLDAFLLRSLAVAGYAPALAECAMCGATDLAIAPAGGATGGSRTFAIAAGGLTCRSCRPPGRRDAVGPDDRADDRAAARGLGACRRGGTQAPSRVQRSGRRLSAVAPGAFDPLAPPRGARVTPDEEPA